MENDVKRCDFSSSKDGSSHFHEVFPNVMGLLAGFRMESYYLGTIVEGLSDANKSFERDVFKYKLHCEEVACDLGVLHDHMYLIRSYYKTGRGPLAENYEEYVMSETGRIAKNMFNTIEGVRKFWLYLTKDISNINGGATTYARSMSLVIEIICSLRIFISYFKEFGIDMSDVENALEEMEGTSNAH